LVFMVRTVYRSRSYDATRQATASPYSWPSLHLGNLVGAMAAGAATVALYAGRTDFTR